MLSSRYLHLHEALGLGPMWLSQGASVREAAMPAQAAPARPLAVKPQATPSTERTLSPHAHQARLAALASIQQPQKPHEIPPPPPAPRAAPPAMVVNIPDRPSETTANSQAIAVAQVMAISICPVPEDILQGALLSGEAGVLFNNMLAAIGLSSQHVHKTSWVQSVPAFTPKPEISAAQIQANLARMQAELRASQAQAVVLLGDIFETPELSPIIAALCQNVPHFMLPHPARLLRRPQLKAQAWQQLKALRALLQHSI